MSDEPQFAGCESYGLVSIHHTARGIVRRDVMACPACERRTPALVQWDGAYYGETTWCLACLRCWMDGEWMPNPFQRNWKRDRIAKLRKMWDAAMMPDEYRRWVRLDVHRVTCDVEGDCAECNADPRVAVAR